MKKYYLLFWLLCGFASLAQAQNRDITGTVKLGEKGETVPGVTVLVKGSTTGAATDLEGRFKVSVPAQADVTLRFSYLGYVTEEVKVGQGSTANATLAEDSKQLDDVVVIGYQEIQRRDVTGAVSSVNAQQIKDIPVNSAAEALTGRLAGVQLTSSEGTPGNLDVRVRIRGGGSVTQDNSPLYIVDGVQVENALQVISPQDIASVDVLKDASATAIYGARGSNGVVIITTKGGREGKVTVTYSGFAGFRRIAKTLSVMRPADYVDYQFERAALVGNNSGGTPTFLSNFGSLTYRTTSGFDTLGASRNAPFIDWQREAFGRDAFQQTHNVSIAGGVKGTTYSLSLTRNNEQGIQLGSDYGRNVVNLRLDNKASDKFKIGVSVRFNDQRALGAGTSTSGSATTSRLRNAVEFQPLAIPINDDDPTVFDDDFFQTSSLINPIVAINSEYKSDKRRTLNLGGNATFNFTKSFAYRATLGVDMTNTTVETFNGRYSPSIRQVSGGYLNLPFATVGKGEQNTLNFSNVLTYKYKTGKHVADALLGQEIYQQTNTTLNIQTNYLPIDITPDRALANINQGVLPAGVMAQPVQPGTGKPVDYRLLSGFGRLNYTFNDRYLLTVTFRVDGSSKFAPGSRVGLFPAGSVAWRVSQEEFMKPVTAISDLKLRLSYGLTGNNRINDFLYSQYFQAGNAQYSINNQIVPGTSAISLPNDKLKWETTVSRNAGLDLALFGGRVQFSADVYYNTTRDLLLNQPIPTLLGYKSQLVNVGSTSNRGLELQLSGTVLRNENFNWTANVNTSFNRGRIEDLGTVSEIQGLNSGWAGTASAITQDYVARVGSPVGQMYGFVTDGFYTADDFTSYDQTTRKWILKPGVASDLSIIGGSPGLQPGLLKLKDINGDGVVDFSDRTVIGNANPRFTGGLNQQFSYKGFDASIFMNWVVGNDVYNANKIEFTTSVYPLGNLLDIMNDRYRLIDNNGVVITSPEASRAANPNANIWTPTRQYVFHSWAVEDASFLRINNVTLGYALPKKLIERAKLTQLRFYVTLNNVYTFTKYTGYDPEVNTRRATPLTPGVDYAAYPRSRAFLFGLNLTL